VSRYKVSKWTGCYPGIVILLTVMARSGFVSYPTPLFKAEAKSKNHDKLINYTVRVIRSFFVSFYRVEILWSRSCYHSKTKLSPEFNASE